MNKFNKTSQFVIDQALVSRKPLVWIQLYYKSWHKTMKTAKMKTEICCERYHASAVDSENNRKTGCINRDTPYLIAHH